MFFLGHGVDVSKFTAMFILLPSVRWSQ